MQVFQNETFDAERALYGVHSAQVINCEFAGPADGESALKECSNIQIDNCRFLLRYPLWHLHGPRCGMIKILLLKTVKSAELKPCANVITRC